jgi:hypothetical protein
MISALVSSHAFLLRFATIRFFDFGLITLSFALITYFYTYTLILIRFTLYIKIIFYIIRYALYFLLSNCCLHRPSKLESGAQESRVPSALGLGKW